MAKGGTHDASWPVIRWGRRPFGSCGKTRTRDASTVTVSVTKEKEVLSAPVAQANVGNNAVRVPSVSLECQFSVYPSFLSEAAPSTESSVKRTPCCGWHRCRSYV